MNMSKIKHQSEVDNVFVPQENNPLTIKRNKLNTVKTFIFKSDFKSSLFKARFIVFILFCFSFFQTARSATNDFCPCLTQTCTS